MVWSLSKDDDGLDSVHPLSTDGRSVAAAGITGRSAPPARSASQVPTVVVDPVSQMPQAPSPGARQRAVEQTLVLKGRKLDQIRAQVAAQRAAHQRRKQMRLLTWAFAGGVALSLGWIAGVTLNFGSPEGRAASSGAELEANSSVQRESELQAAAEPTSEGVAVSGDQSSVKKETQNLELADLPPEPDTVGETESSPQEPTTSDEGRSATPHPEPDAFTLDDLPFD